jgi:hypothetical protein
MRSGTAIYPSNEYEKDKSMTFEVDNNFIVSANLDTLKVASEETKSLVVIKITSAEISNNKLSPSSLFKAVEAVNTNGYVVLENAVPHQCIDVLREKMVADSKGLLAKGKWDAVGKVKGHLKQAPPPYAPYVFPEIVSNPFAGQVTEQILGKGRFNKFYHGNTNCPGSGMQPVHPDGVEHALIVNVGLGDITEYNGSIELWPGTHLIENSVARIEKHTLEARRKLFPPIRGNTKKGSILIRDAQVWHRGMPNLSNDLRFMVSMMHYKHTADLGKMLVFNHGCEEAFHDKILHPNVRFSSEDIDYLRSDYSFLQALKDSLYRISPTAFAFLSKIQRSAK